MFHFVLIFELGRTDLVLQTLLFLLITNFAVGFMIIHNWLSQAGRYPRFVVWIDLEAWGRDRVENAIMSWMTCPCFAKMPGKIRFYGQCPGLFFHRMLEPWVGTRPVLRLPLPGAGGGGGYSLCWHNTYVPPICPSFWALFSRWPP